MIISCCFLFFQAEGGIRDHCVTGVQTCALPISSPGTPGVPGVPGIPGTPPDWRGPRPPRLARAPRAPRGYVDVPPGCPSEDDDERVAALNALMQMEIGRASCRERV